MHGQLSLSGFDAERTATDRLFIGIVPEADAAAQIAQLAYDQRNRHGMSGRMLRREQFHVSLYHIGNYAGLPKGVVTSVCEAAATITAKPFDVVFDRAGSFRAGPFVLLGTNGVTALKAFQQSLVLTMKRAGCGRRAQSQFNPHVTMLYDACCLVIDHGVEAVRWTVREFVLVHSLVGLSRHVHLARWPLRD